MQRNHHQPAAWNSVMVLFHPVGFIVSGCDLHAGERDDSPPYCRKPGSGTPEHYVSSVP